MKINHVVLLLVLFISAQTEANAQNTITDVDSIPLVCYLYGLNDWGENWGLEQPRYSEDEFKRIDSLRFHAVEIFDLTESQYTRDLTYGSFKFKIIPDQMTESKVGFGKNLIIKYTEAKYSVWQAEGTPPDDGEATVVANPTYTANDDSGKFIFTVDSVQIPYGTELINGPSYVQDARYNSADTGKVDYRADFRMKLQELVPGITLVTDTVCNLQITTCLYDVVNNQWVKTDSFIIEDEPILFGDFTELDEWLSFYVNYDLYGLPDWYYNNYSKMFINKPPNYRWDNTGRNHIQHIEFKIIWKGNSQVIRLFVDSITVYDERGYDLVNVPLITDDIIDMIRHNYPYKNKISGWFGLDEPHSIDNFEPIRIISELLESQPGGAKLWISLPGSWSGRWGNPGHPLSAGERIHIIDEYFKRVKRGNVLQNLFPLEMPYPNNLVLNIDRITDSTYAHFNMWPGANWGSGILTGAVPSLNYGEIDREELLYSTNLALLYGAKIIAPWLIFGTDVPDRDNVSALINDIIDNPWANPPHIFVTTEKYFTMRDTIAPRVGGLMGKTLKKLKPQNQYAGSNGIEYPYTNSYRYINKLIWSTYDESTPPIFEFGFFCEPAYDNTGDEKRFFMLLNRYYPNRPYDIFKIEFKNLTGFINWKLINYIDTTSYTMIPNIFGMSESNNFTITKGDAILFGLHPVIKYGGDLIANETVPSGTTLYDDMTITNNATLTVNGTYFAKANITVKSGSKIVAGPSGKIVFDPGKGIIIDGDAEIKGTSNNRLVLEFHNSTEVGIYVPTGKSLNITYSDICKAKIGVKSESPASLTISNVNIDNCFSTGIVVVSVLEPLQALYIKNCNITNSGMGVSVTGTDEIVIKQNNIYQCNRGMMLINVNSAYISGNSITGKSLPNGSVFAGIYLQSTGGYLRNNTIKFHSAGVHLASSSPDMGVNEIVSNKFFGLYVDYGSYPNLVKRLANPSCWYPIGGCNIIQNNGIYDGISPENQEDTPFGSEIYLNHSDVQLSGGENEISDDREGIPAYLTIPLIKGSSVTREVIADYNYWGIVGPSQNRFGSLNVVYEPISDFCMLPAAPCSGGNEIVIQTSDGSIVDTLESRQRESAELSDLEELYAMADKLFYSGDIEGAQAVYQQIINGQYSNEEKLYAYKKLYDIGEILREDDQYFIALQNALNSILAVETDTLLLKAFGQRSILCDVSRQEYISAIEKFDEIIQQNPNSTEAVYAEIDILTTALYLDTTSTQLGKMNGGKYLVKGTSVYLTRVNDLLNSKFGINTEKEGTIIPKEYVLYQNYPNPFNPTTTIKFDLPKDGVIELGIYDILGRKITTLINEYRSAGSYEQSFNASSLASGIYLYRIKVNDFVSAKKMILVK